jgi:hypothetical protein
MVARLKHGPLPAGHIAVQFPHAQPTLLRQCLARKGAHLVLDQLKGPFFLEHRFATVMQDCLFWVVAFGVVATRPPLYSESITAPCRSNCRLLHRRPNVGDSPGVARRPLRRPYATFGLTYRRIGGESLWRCPWFT